MVDHKRENENVEESNSLKSQSLKDSAKSFREVMAARKESWLDPKYYVNGRIQLSNILRYLNVPEKLAENKNVIDILEHDIFKQRGLITFSSEEEKNQDLIKRISELVNVSEKGIHYSFKDRVFYSFNERLFEVNEDGGILFESVTTSRDGTNRTTEKKIYNKNDLLMLREYTSFNSNRGFSFYTTIRDENNPFIAYTEDKAVSTTPENNFTKQITYLLTEDYANFLFTSGEENIDISEDIEEKRSNYDAYAKKMIDRMKENPGNYRALIRTVEEKEQEGKESKR